MSEATQNETKTTWYECSDCNQACETEWLVNEKETVAKRRSKCCGAKVTTRDSLQVVGSPSQRPNIVDEFFERKYGHD